MAGDRFDEAEAIFQIAADLAPDERAAILADRCGDDSELFSLVNRLLEYHDGGMGRFLNPSEPRLFTRIDDDAVLPERIGSYEILHKIGEGGMATVFEARQSNPRRVVALKVVKGAIVDTTLIRRFHFETKVLARLSHRGIARVYEAGETAEGVPFFAMELVQGLPLTQYAEEHKLDTTERFELVAQICDAVHYAHENGVLHRDLKPANILVTDQAGRKPQPKILDFGVARALHSDLQTVSMYTSTGQLVGTLAYMSPEQIIENPDDLDARSDVYQLGVLLYELLAGKRPYSVTDLSVPQATRVILEDEPPPLRTVDTRYRGDAEAIVGKALYKERERRYASAAELASDIRRHLTHEPIMARPASGIYRLRKLAVRRKETLAGLAAGLVVAIALAVALLISVRNRGPEGPTPPHATQLTATSGDAGVSSSALSPDGSTLAFTNADGLFLQDIESKEISPIPLPAGYRRAGWVHWRRTEHTLLTRLVGEGYGAWHFVTPDGEIEPALAEEVVEAMGGTPIDLRMAPDGGKWLLRSADYRSLWVMDRDGGNLENLVTVPEISGIESAVWSPSGETIAYLSGGLRSGAYAQVLSSIDLDGNTVALSEPDPRLTQSYALSGGSHVLWWLADGRLVYSRAMASPNSTSSEIVALPVDPASGTPQGEEEILAGWIGSGISSLWASAAGDRLTFLRHQTQEDIFLVDLDVNGRFAGTPDRFTVDTRIDRLGVWSPDGERIFFQSTRFGRWYVLSKRLGDPTPAKFVAGHDHESFLDLAPGGTDLLIVPRLTGGIDTAESLAVLRVPISGGNPEPVVLLNPNERIQCGSDPGAPCVLSRATETGVVFFRLDEHWLPEVELGRADTGNEYISWAVAPDGRELVLLTRWDAAVRLLDLETGQWRLLCQQRRLQFVTYSPDGMSFYISRYNPYAILRVTRDGESEELWRSDLGWAWSPRVSPDGKRLAFGVREFDADVWMIEGF